MTSDHSAYSVLSFGEILWDALPAGLFLGGAPFNVACHLHTLGVSTQFAGRVGRDRLGSEILRRMKTRGMDTHLMQVDPRLPTGFVEVALDPDGKPTFDIVHPSAWDNVEMTEDLRTAATQARAIVFGSLSQRSATTRGTLRELLRSDALSVCDVNMRPPFVDREVILASLEAADLVKLNDEELKEIAAWMDWPRSLREGADRMARECDVTAVCVTRGAEGAVLRHGDAVFEHPGYRVRVADTVGAGDAFLAGFLKKYLEGRPPQDILDFACRAGAYVASREGATPEYTLDDLDRL
jgi:fructokinase